MRIQVCQSRNRNQCSSRVESETGFPRGLDASPVFLEGRIQNRFSSRVVSKTGFPSRSDPKPVFSRVGSGSTISGTKIEEKQKSKKKECNNKYLTKLGSVKKNVFTEGQINKIFRYNKLKERKSSKYRYN